MPPVTRMATVSDNFADHKHPSQVAGMTIPIHGVQEKWMGGVALYVCQRAEPLSFVFQEVQLAIYPNLLAGFSLHGGSCPAIALR